MPLSMLRTAVHYLLAALLWWLVVRAMARMGIVDLGTALDVVAVVGLAVATARWTARLAGEVAGVDLGGGDHMMSPSPAVLLEETASLRKMAEAAHDVRCPACGHALAHGHLPLGLLTECPHCHTGVAVRLEAGKADVRLTGIE